MSHAKDYQGQIFLGILIILVGFIFLLGSLDKLDVGYVFSMYWPLILVIIGLWHLVSSQNAFIGILLIAIGSVFQLAKWDILGRNVWSVFWPLLIIAVGLWIIFRPRFRGFEGKIPKVKDDDLGAFVMFSGINRRMESKEFRGGKATALFGGIDLDFTKASLAGNEATVELTAIFGGIGVKVPREWKVIVDSNAIFGGVDDKHKGTSEAEAKNTFFIRATAIFGGVDIKNA